MSDFFCEGRTRTPGTEDRYQAVVSRLVDEFIYQNGDYLDPVSPWLFVNWLIRKKKSLSQNSWRQYCAATLWHLRRQGWESTEEAANFLEEQTQEGALKETCRTSGQKAKSIPLGELRQIMATLILQRSKYDRRLVFYLRAGVATGLRECEWPRAYLAFDDEGRLILLVPNAKATNGRANGTERTIHLSHYHDFIVKAVKQWLAIAQTTRDYDKLLEGMCERFRNVVRTLWPGREKYPSLSSTRHQFAANAKKQGLSKPEIAALMGHASDQTAGQHYGVRASGWGVLKDNEGREIGHLVPIPNPSEVATVRQTISRRENTALEP